MIRRKWGIGGSAPGAGGIFWYYVKDVDEVEGDEEEEEVKENEIAKTFLTGLKEGNAPVEFTKMQIRAIEKEGKTVMKQSSAQIDEEIYEVDINLARSSWKIGMINRSEHENGDFETRLYDYFEGGGEIT